MEYPSKLIEDAVNEISKLPGIGKKTALRLALYLLKEEEEYTHTLTQALLDLKNKTRYCKTCNNIADSDICSVCNNPHRDLSTLCVVESTTDLIAIENTAQYQGLYHVLGGVISPVEGIGPDDVNIDSLVNRLQQPDNEVNEIILALSSTMEGETTAFYITKKLKEFDVKISSIARGVPIGSELEYTDEITLGRSITNRKDYNHGQ